MGAVADFGAVGDGVTDDRQAILDAITAGGVVEFDPERTYAMGGNITVASRPGLRIRGNGATIKRIGATNIALTFAACDRLSITDLSFDMAATGPGTSMYGLRIQACSDVQISGGVFANHVGQAILYNPTTATKRLLVEGATFVGGWGFGVSSVSSDIYVNAADVETVRVRDCTFTAAPGNTGMGIAVFAVANAIQRYRDFSVSGCTVRGYSRAGLGVTNEAPASAYTSGEVSFTDNHIADCLQQGIKTKNVRRVTIRGNTVVGCNTVPEKVSLRGGIFVNCIQQAVIVGNSIFDDGTSGIRCEGNSDVDGGSLDGTGRAQLVIDGNLIANAAEASIDVEQRNYDVTISANTVQGGAGTGIRLNGQNAAPGDRIKSVAISGNTVRSAGVSGISASYCDGLAVTGNVVRGSSQSGIVVASASDVVITGNVSLDNGQLAPATYDGIRYSSVTSCLVANNRSGNREGASQRYGISIAGTNTNDKVTNNECSGNATAATLGTAVVMVGN